MRAVADEGGNESQSCSVGQDECFRELKVEYPTNAQLIIPPASFLCGALLREKPQNFNCGAFSYLG